MCPCSARNSFFCEAFCHLSSADSLGKATGHFFLRDQRVAPPTCKLLVNSHFDDSIFAVEHRGSLLSPIHCRAKSFTCRSAYGELARAAHMQVNRWSFKPCTPRGASQGGEREQVNFEDLQMVESDPGCSRPTPRTGSKAHFAESAYPSRLLEGWHVAFCAPLSPTRRAVGDHNSLRS